MQMPVDIKAQGITITEAQETAIREKVEKLEKFYDRIVRVRVTVEGPGAHHKTGTIRVRIDLTVPGSEIMITRQSGQDLQEALREAFQAAGRCLEDHVRKSRGYVKLHPESQSAWVLRVFPESGYGFLEDAGGREIYFHRNSVVNGSFKALAPGAKVHYTEEPGQEGPQARIVVVHES